MNLTRQMKDIENLYSEKVNFPPKGTFELAKDAKEKKKPFVGGKTGPEASDGFNVKISDPKHLKGEETFQGTEKFSSENFTENTEKVEKNDQQGINTFMSKSIFDKLFEDVMGNASEDAQDAIDLGVEVGGDEAKNETGDVTITLDRELAQKLHDVLMGVLGGEAEAEAESEDAENGDAASEDAEHKAKKEHEEEDNQEVAGEATELTAVPDAKGLSLAGKNNKVGDETAKLVAKGEGDGSIKDGADGKLHPQKEVGATSPKGKANVVAGKASNVGHYLFQK
jgi:hypothetical protein